MDEVMCCMRCQSNFRYLQQGVDTPLEFIPKVFSLRWSVCDECCEELKENYANRNKEVVNAKK